jgi:hypothetical protein
MNDIEINDRTIVRFWLKNGERVDAMIRDGRLKLLSESEMIVRPVASNAIEVDAIPFSEQRKRQ